MADIYLKFTGRIDRRSPRNEGDYNSPTYRQNMTCRDGRNKKIPGTEKYNLSALEGIPRWGVKYYSLETGVKSPKSFVYTDMGYLYYIDENGSATKVKSDLAKNARPKHCFVKTGEQTKLYIVDGENMYSYDGNNDNLVKKVNILNADGVSIQPIDVIEYLERLWVISRNFLVVSKNQEFDVFNDADDSFAGVVGSGKGTNLKVVRVVDDVFMFNTEGIFKVIGRTISSVASTWGIDFVADNTSIIAGSICKVEGGIIFVGDNYELWSFGGTKASIKMLSYLEKLKDFITDVKAFNLNVDSTYHDNFYKLSFTRNGDVFNNMEIWYDTINDRCEYMYGRNVSCYFQNDKNFEKDQLYLGRSDIPYVMYADRGLNFDGQGIEIKLETKDITVKKGKLVRFTDFFPEIEPTGERVIFFRYLLDGKLSNSPDDGSFQYDLSGEALTLGLIRINNQAQVTKRVQPKINYALGESVRFEVYDANKNLEFSMLGIGINYTDKEGGK